MRTKYEISGSEMDLLKEKYLVDTLNTNRTATIIGAYGNNICGEIKNVFMDNDIIVHTIDKKPIDVNYTSNNVASYICADMTDEKNIDTVATLDQSDILVLGHGTMQLDWFEDYTYKQMEYIIQNNLLSHMKIVNRWIRQTIEKRYKKYLIIIGSMAYDNVLNGSIPYMVSKAGLAMLARGLAWELAPKNYNVICIHPSNTKDTPMTERTILEIMRFRHVDYADAESYWSAVLPKMNFLTKNQIAELALFFVSGKCDYLSGSNIELRGGQR